MSEPETPTPVVDEVARGKANGALMLIEAMAIGCLKLTHAYNQLARRVAALEHNSTLPQDPPETP